MHLEPETTLPTPTGLRAFVDGLALDGRARLQSKPLDPAEPMPQSGLEHTDALARLELVREAPPLDLTAAHWAATALYACARAIVDRHTETSALNSFLTPPFPKDRGASIHWSVDLFLRYLPSLSKLAAQVSRTDPILPTLQRLGTDWPLSSVGMALGEPPIALETILDHPALRRLYLDRIETQPDRSRLKDPRLLEAVRADLGLHRDRFDPFRDFVPPSPPA